MHRGNHHPASTKTVLIASVGRAGGRLCRPGGQRRELVAWFGRRGSRGNPGFPRAKPVGQVPKAAEQRPEPDPVLQEYLESELHRAPSLEQADGLVEVDVVAC